MSHFDLDHLLTSTLFADLEDAIAASEPMAASNEATELSPEPYLAISTDSDLPARKLPAWGNHVAPLGLIVPDDTRTNTLNPPPLPLEDRYARDFPELQRPATFPRPEVQAERDATASPVLRPAASSAQPDLASDRLAQAAQALEMACERLNQATERLMALQQPYPQPHAEPLYQACVTPGGGRPGAAR